MLSGHTSLRSRDTIEFSPVFASLVAGVWEVAALCLPALFNRDPIVYPDTRAYYLGGRAAVEKIASVLQPADGIGGSDALASALQKARGVRSAYYSLLVYVPAHVLSLWLVVLLQAVVVAFVLRLAFNLVCPDRGRWQTTAFITAVALTTTLPWTVSLIMPDVFTGVMALSLMLVAVFWRALDTPARIGLFAVIAGSLVMHLTNLPMALGILAASFLVTGVRDYRRYVMIGGAVARSAAAMLAVGVGGFHQWTMAPQAPPFLLARSLEDGPARLYLQDHCPRINLVMCRHIDQLDTTTGMFLWDERGIYSSASLEEQAALRAEDKTIYLHAALEHPWMQLHAMAHNALLQLGLFTLHEYAIPSSAQYTPTDMTLYNATPEESWWQPVFSIPNYLFVAVALGFLGHAWYRGRLSPVQRQLVSLVLATVILSALAGALSEPVPRYQARVIWLLPMVALLIASQNLSRRRS